MDLENFFEQILQPQFPLQELVKIHHDLTQFENYLRMDCGGYYKMKTNDIEIVYEVQELIEEVVSEYKKEIKREAKEKEIQGLDLDF